MKYPCIDLAVVECTQVPSFSDTIRRVMDVDVLDPIKLGTSALELFADHAFAQDGPSARLKQVKQLKLVLGRCEELDEVVKVLGDEVAKQKVLEEKERGALGELEVMIAKEVAALKELNKEEWVDIERRGHGQKFGKSGRSTRRTLPC